MFFFYCPSMAYKEILSQDVKTFSGIKEGNVNCPPLIDPRQGRAFCKVFIGHIFFLFLLGKNRHKMYLRHILCIKDIFNFEYFLLSVCLYEGDGIKYVKQRDVVCRTILSFQWLGFVHTKIWPKMSKYITFGSLLSHKSR